ncbi:GNAT family N-acetyltransferase [Peterkaempfera griseoplana]|uniref:GNAT family N-acetyltransferase n=1 Tax=Peterkaempfera griseoplana TaxID=66896 RepID=UPI0006E463AA|nr:GNAT family N-acetyltransferase [Peterkaempfera griseoplana]
MDTAAGSPAVTVREAGPEQRPVIERLVQLYRHDMSEFLGHLPGDDGLFTFRQLPLFFSEPDRRALLIHHGPTLAGFALTRPLPDGATSISAFFVVRALRRHGVGLRAALELLRSRPGPWAIAFQQANAGAGRFWRQVAGAAVGTAWSEEQRPVPPPAPPGLPPDVWILLDTGPSASPASTSAPASG